MPGDEGPLWPMWLLPFAAAVPGAWTLYMPSRLNGVDRGR
jgi:membrane protein DedA with SNARE-associated domain